MPTSTPSLFFSCIITCNTFSPFITTPNSTFLFFIVLVFNICVFLFHLTKQRRYNISKFCLNSKLNSQCITNTYFKKAISYNLYSKNNFVLVIPLFIQSTSQIHVFWTIFKVSRSWIKIVGATLRTLQNIRNPLTRSHTLTLNRIASLCKTVYCTEVAL